MYYYMAKNQAKSLNSKNLSLVKKIGGKNKFTITFNSRFIKPGVLPTAVT